MSAFVVEDEHISALVNAADHHARRGHGQFHWYAKDEDGATVHYELSRTGEDSVEPAYTVRPEYSSSDYAYPEHIKVSFASLGAMLLAENMRSVNDRYDEDDVEHIYQHSALHVTPVATLKATQCYEYQSCEHEGWETSAAKAFCEALTHSIISDLPGYEDAPWDLVAENANSVAI